MLVLYGTVNGGSVWINPLQVTHLVSYDAKHTHVHFAGGGKELVKATPNDLAKDLDHHLQKASLAEEDRG